ncbi:MAG: MBL fold metallo-hydrolase [Bacteroidota bacterium]
MLVEIQPFVVVTSKDILLLDMGLGFSQNGKMQLHQNLVNAGINPSAITKVLLTHLHKDHAGGVSEDSDHSQLSFPGATYYLQGKEN